jgi:hypothetical protein
MRYAGIGGDRHKLEYKYEHKLRFEHRLQLKFRFKHEFKFKRQHKLDKLKLNLELQRRQQRK